MEIIQRFRHLHNNVSAEILAEVGQPDDLMEKLPPGTELQNDKVVLSRFGEFNELHDIRVIELTHNLNLFEDVGALWNPSPPISRHNT